MAAPGTKPAMESSVIRENEALKAKLLELKSKLSELEDVGGSPVSGRSRGTLQDAEAMKRENMQLKKRMREMEGQTALRSPQRGVNKTPSPERTRSPVVTTGLSPTATREKLLLKEENAQLKKRVKELEDETSQQKTRINDLEAAAVKGATAIKEKAALATENQQLRAENSRLSLRARTVSPEQLRMSITSEGSPAKGSLQIKEPMTLSHSVGSLPADVSRQQPQADILARARQREPLLKRSTDMPVEMQHRAIESAKAALMSNSDFTAVADAIKAGFQQSYGSAWQCVVGLDAHTGFSVWRSNEAYLNVTFGEVKIILFKAGPEPRAELVAKARAEAVVVRESTMSYEMQAHAIERGRQALGSFIRFNDMVKGIREDIQTAYGGVWQCVVAEEGHVAFSFRHLDAPYLYIAFGKVCMIMLKAGHLPPSELLALASMQEPEILGCTLQPPVEQHALQCARAAFKQHQDFDAVAASVESGMSNGCGGAWEVVVGIDVHVGHPARAGADAFLEAKFGEVKLLVFQSQGGGHMPPAEIIARTVGMEAVITKSAMPPAMQQYAVQVAKSKFPQFDDFTPIAEATKDDMNSRWGGGWHCICGLDVHNGHRIRPLHDTYLEFTLGEVQVVLCKAMHLKQDEVLWMAKGADPHVVMSTMPSVEQHHALDAIRAALRQLHDFASVAEHAKEGMAKAHGGSWGCIVGLAVHCAHAGAARGKEHLEVTFGELQVSLFKAGAAETVADFIAKARGEEAVVKESTMQPPMQQHAIERTRQAIREHMQFAQVLHDVRQDFEASYGGKWHCVVVDELHAAIGVRRSDAPYVHLAFGRVGLVLAQAGHLATADIIQAAALEEPRVQNSTVSLAVQQCAIDAAKAALRSSTELATVADAVQEGVTKAFGGVWQCSLGVSAMQAHRVRPAAESYLEVAFGELTLILFEAWQDMRGDSIMVARTSGAEVKQSTMSPPMQQATIRFAQAAINRHDHFEEVARAVRSDAAKEFGGVWHVVAAECERSGLAAWPEGEARLQVAFGSVEVFAFKSGPEPHAGLLARAALGEVDVEETTMPLPMQERAVGDAKAALAGANNFDQVAATLEDGFAQAYGGVWNCVVATEIDLAFRLQHSGPTYLHAIFGSVAVVLYQGGHASKAELLKLAKTGEVEVLNSSVAPNIKDCAIASAKAAFGTSKDFAGVAEAVAGALRRGFGGVWRCVVGLGVHFGSWARHGKEEYLEVKIGDLRMVVLRTGAVSQADVIAAARGREPVVRAASVPPGVEPLALRSTRAALDRLDDLNAVAEEVKEVVTKTFGGVWQLLLGVDLQFGAALAPSSEAYLECSFGEVEMVLFQAGALDQADLIAAAKGMEPKVKDSTLPAKVQKDALLSAAIALQQHRTFTAIAEALRDQLTASCGGLWQCTAGCDAMYGYGLRPAPHGFVAVSFGELSVVMFRTAHASSADIISAAKGVEAEIIKSTVRDDVQQLALEKAQSELGLHTDFASLAGAVHEDLNKTCGGGWQCLAGLGVHYGCWVSMAPEAWLDVKYGELHMVMFRTSRHCSQSEIIDSAQTEQPIVRKTTLTKGQQTRAIQAALKMFGEHARFGDVAKAIREDFIGEYGGVWHVIIAVAEHAGFSVWPANEGYLNVLFGEIEMILFKAYTNWF